MAEPFSCALRVRYGECDPQGVVFNSHYRNYFDVGLTDGLGTRGAGRMGGWPKLSGD